MIAFVAPLLVVHSLAHAAVLKLISEGEHNQSIIWVDGSSTRAGGVRFLVEKSVEKIPA